MPTRRPPSRRPPPEGLDEAAGLDALQERLLGDDDPQANSSATTGERRSLILSVATLLFSIPALIGA